MAIRVTHFGLGPIGCAVARQVAQHQGLKIVGGIDIDSSKVGKDVGELTGLSSKLGVQVAEDALAVLNGTKSDVVILCTSSSLDEVLPQIETVLKMRVPIISTAEELSYPLLANRNNALKIDELAKQAKVAVLGTGINPGFLMDTLPITLSGVCSQVDSIEIDRVQDAGKRRLPFQLKIGAGLTREQFLKKVETRKVGHVGLLESMAMIARAFGWELQRVTDVVEPKITMTGVSTEFLTVDPGCVCGIVQRGVGYRNGIPVITLRFDAALGNIESYDAVRINGSPSLSMKIDGGVPGDIGTASIIVNSIPKVIAASPGLQTMLDLPIPSCLSVGTSL